MKLIEDEVKDDIRLRIDKIRKEIKKAGMDAVVIASNANIYYVTGRIFRGYVYIPVEGDPVWYVVKPDIYEADENIIVIRKPELIPEALAKKGVSSPSAIGFEFDSLSYSDVSRLKSIFPASESKNGSVPLIKARMTKTPFELQKMKEDGVHQSEAYRRVTHCFKEDMTDVQFQIEIERVLRLEGCLGFVRTNGTHMDINLGSVIAGSNADTPSPYDFTMGGAGTDPSLPVGANGTTLKPGQTVMVDVCGSFNGYQTDMTRVWRLGEIPAIAEKAHRCSISILRACESIGKPGIPVAELYLKAMEIVASQNLSEFFMGHRQQVSFIGHGVGIELNEPPVVMAKSKDVLRENMTLALEPKFVIPEVGAVGVENTYVVTPEGLKSITVFPEDIQEL